jgi:hypothetical protein
MASMWHMLAAKKTAAAQLTAVKFKTPQHRGGGRVGACNTSETTWYGSGLKPKRGHATRK